MKLKRLVVLLLPCFLLAGCESSVDDADAMNESEATAQEENVSEAAVREKNDSEVFDDEPEIVCVTAGNVPYAEEHGFVFTDDLSFTTPSCFYQSDGEGNQKSSDGVSVLGVVDSYAEVVDVVYYNRYYNSDIFNMDFYIDYSADTVVMRDRDVCLDDDFSLHHSCNLNVVGVVDYYTGLVFHFDTEALNTNTIGSSKYAAEITVGDETYPVSCRHDVFARIKSSDWHYLDSGNSQEKILSLESNDEYHATMPSGYDGLCIAVNLRGETQPFSDDVSSEPVLFMDTLEADEDINDYVFIRVSDIIVDEIREEDQK